MLITPQSQHPFPSDRDWDASEFCHFVAYVKYPVDQQQYKHGWLYTQVTMLAVVWPVYCKNHIGV